MEPVRAIGLMSGTSMDGIDAALVETDGEGRATCGPALMIPYEAAFRRRIEAALEDAKVIARRDQRPGDLAGLEREITDRHAAAVEALLGRAGLARQDITVIGFHGQTVLHRPQAGLTVQIGDGARLAALTGIDVPVDSSNGYSDILDWHGNQIASAGAGQSSVANAYLDMAGLRAARLRPQMSNMLSRQALELFAGSYASADLRRSNGLLDGGKLKIPDRSYFQQRQADAIQRMVERGIL